MTNFVIGHKNPDTDSVVSAIALAEFFGYTPAVAGEINNETKFVLEKFGFQEPEKLGQESKVILVDTNGNPDELPEFVTPENIIGVIDHHKLGGLKTAEPIPVNIQTVGATGTLIASVYKDSGKEIPKNIAGILLSAIVSDTLKFTSPTTTEIDKNAAQALAEIAGVEVENLAEEMFAAKSDISDIPTSELLKKDYKIFEMKGKKVGIGVWETTLPELVQERSAEIRELLENQRKDDGLDFIYFGVVDIVNSKTNFFAISEAEAKIAEKAFDCKVVKGVAELPGVVSRKKQIAPAIEGAVA